MSYKKFKEITKVYSGSILRSVLCVFMSLVVVASCAVYIEFGYSPRWVYQLSFRLGLVMLALSSFILFGYLVWCLVRWLCDDGEEEIGFRSIDEYIGREVVVLRDVVVDGRVMIKKDEVKRVEDISTCRRGDGNIVARVVVRDSVGYRAHLFFDEVRFL